MNGVRRFYTKDLNGLRFYCEAYYGKDGSATYYVLNRVIQASTLIGLKRKMTTIKGENNV